jgi:hypothetical protein
MFYSFKPYNIKYVMQECVLLSIWNKKNAEGAVLTSNAVFCSMFPETHKMPLIVIELCNCLKHYHPAAIALRHT